MNSDRGIERRACARQVKMLITEEIEAIKKKICNERKKRFHKYSVMTGNGPKSYLLGLSL